MLELTLCNTESGAPAQQSAYVREQALLTPAMMGVLINLSGQRRFTSQRVVLYAVLGSLGHEGAIATARQTLALFREAHTTLMEGKGGVPGIFCEQLKEAYFGTLQGDAAITDFLATASAALDAIAGETRAAPALLDTLVRGATPLLAVLNGLTLVYEEQAKRHAQRRNIVLRNRMAEIKAQTRQARLVALKAQLVGARAGAAGTEFAALAQSMALLTGDIDTLVQQTVDAEGNF
ncbi:MAG: methyl-accepting chemotaxis protein [Pseudomonadota bacterium]